MNIYDAIMKGPPKWAKMLAAAVFLFLVGAQTGIYHGRVMATEEQIGEQLARKDKVIAEKQEEIKRLAFRMTATSVQRELDRWTPPTAMRRAATMTVTGYCDCNECINIVKPKNQQGRTALGTWARDGVCAADWRVFPPGTILWIRGYGQCVVQDTGGAIKGNSLDLFFYRHEDAREWGRQVVDVLVLAEGKTWTPRQSPRIVKTGGPI